MHCVATPAQTGIGPAVHPALSIGSTLETPAGATTGDGQALRVLAAHGGRAGSRLASIVTGATQYDRRAPFDGEREHLVERHG